MMNFYYRFILSLRGFFCQSNPNPEGGIFSAKNARNDSKLRLYFNIERFFQNISFILRSNDQRLPAYGGQAVIEGVMMRGKRTMAVAMRAPDKKIIIHQEPLGRIYQSNLGKIPFLRGMVMLWDALGLGIRALTISANVQTGEDEKIEGPALYLTLAVSLALGVGLFFLAPAAVGQAAEKYLSWSAWGGNLMEGIVRLGLLVGYIWLVGRLPDIQRVFAYHGAEHKTINAFEANAELTPESVSPFSLEHPRCGTAFLLTLVLISVLLFTMLGPLSIFWRLASRVVLIPVLAGLAYEYIRWSASHLKSPIMRILIRPNLALQRLTTREPDLDMLEVAIAAFNAMREEEEQLSIPDMSFQSTQQGEVLSKQMKVHDP